MFLSNPAYATISALMAGYDLATSGGALAGFREWLIPRVGGRNNLGWPELALFVVFPEAVDPEEVLSSRPDGDSRAREGLLALMELFLVARASPNGLRRIFLDYEAWLHTQSWYSPKSPQWVPLSAATRSSSPVSKRGRKSRGRRS